MAWSKRLARYAAMLPDLQRGLPVPDAYKAEATGSDSDLNAYDVIYYGGHCNAGSKTIAINLPNDEQVQLAKGTRRLQLKNAIRAKFEKIMVPIAAELIAEDQQRHINFDAFFADVMFHEVAHGLGIKNTINGKGTVREALKDHAGAIEEGKADVLGLYMITKLNERGEVTGARCGGRYRLVRWFECGWCVSDVGRRGHTGRLGVPTGLHDHRLVEVRDVLRQRNRPDGLRRGRRITREIRRGVVARVVHVARGG